MTKQAGAEATTGEAEALEPAFYSRVDQLYRLYEDWTGNVEDETEVPSGGRKQSSGEATIGPEVALSTFMAFAARLAIDLGMPQDDFIAAMGEMFEDEVFEDGAGEEGGESTESGAPGDRRSLLS